ncbi:MAG: DUF1559 domain-containing protein, partial [Planctomycetaceae bacterium]|nr:DUF1559 domain-containing protein [Planctomycetaceae bacterium]
MIAIIGMLIALLLPAIQVAREAARKMQCGNNMKQVTLGTHNFNSTYGMLPPGTSDALPKGNKIHSNYARLSSLFFILPFTEQAARYDACITALNGGNTINDPQTTSATGANLVIWQTAWQPNIFLFLCPSEGNANTGKGTNSPGRNNIMFCAGDFPPYWRGNFRGLFFNINEESGEGRVLEEVTDGMSNTIAVSEAAITDMTGNGVNDGPIRGGIRINLNTGSFPGNDSQKNMSECLNTTNDRKNYIKTNKGIRNDLVGKMWGKGYVGTTMFTTILPPNSPSCTRGNTVALANNTNGRMVVSATSNHTAGVNAGLGDGSVRFISDAVDTGTLDAGITFF